MPECTCSHSVRRKVSDTTFVNLLFELNKEVRIFRPGCPVHEPPHLDEDQYVFKTPPVQSH